MPSMQTDVRSVYKNATGAFGVSRCRIKGFIIVPGGSAGSVVIRDGGAGGAILMQTDTLAASTGVSTGLALVPGEGILSQGDPYVTLTNVVSITLFYG